MTWNVMTVMLLVNAFAIPRTHQRMLGTRALEDNNCFSAKIYGDKQKVLSVLKDKNGILSVEEDLTVRSSDCGVYRIESERGIDIRKTIFYACAENNLPILELTPVGAELEEIFLKLVDKNSDKKVR